MLHIMIVDDMDITRRELKRLKLWGDRTGFVISDEAANGYEALEKLKKNPVDMVITDIRMPKVDGIELLKKITEKKLCLCVVLLSDYSEFRYARQGLILGAFDYMVKPVAEDELDKLLQRAKEFISGKRLEQQRIKQLEQKLVEKVEAFFPQSEVNRLIDAIMTGDARAAEYAEHIVEIAFTNLDYDLIKAESLLNNILLVMAERVAESYKWLNKFISMDKIHSTGISGTDDPGLIKDRFVSTVGEMHKLLERLRYRTQENGVANQVCRFVLDNIDEDVSLKAVTDSLFMNRTYISEAFKQKMGISFTEYLTIVKMERAKKLIGDGRLKGYEVAELLGFKDIEYFSRLFKRYEGCTPTEYRKKDPTNFRV